MNTDQKSPWYEKYLMGYDKCPENVPKSVLDTIVANLANRQSENPLVTIAVIAYNEERNLIACLWSLSDLQCPFPVEIIGVNNNSEDRTEEIFQRLGLPYFNEARNGCGHARLCGLQKARGRYHINIDADTLYPPYYVQMMVSKLSKPGVVAASASWGYIPDENHTKLALTCYEGLRDIFLFLQSFKRPELSVRGLVFGYDTQLARQVGIRTDIKRGEDGSLALGLKKYGRIVFIRNRKARAITGYGTLGAEGSLSTNFKRRITKALRSIPGLFSKKSTYKDEASNLMDNNHNE